MPRKLITLLSAALLATVPMVAFAGGQLGGRVGGAVGGTVGGTAGAGVGGAQAGVNGSGSVATDDRTGVNARRLHSDTKAAGRADTRAGAQVNAPSAGVSAGAQTSGSAGTNTRVEGSDR